MSTVANENGNYDDTREREREKRRRQTEPMSNSNVIHEHTNIDGSVCVRSYQNQHWPWPTSVCRNINSSNSSNRRGVTGVPHHNQESNKPLSSFLPLRVDSERRVREREQEKRERERERESKCKSILVDPASGHMLRFRAKPCKCPIMQASLKTAGL
jgi:hypothetical protein